MWQPENRQVLPQMRQPGVYAGSDARRTQAGRQPGIIPRLARSRAGRVLDATPNDTPPSARQRPTHAAVLAGTIGNLNINTGYTGTITLARSLTINGSYTQATGTFTAGSNALTINGNCCSTAGNFTLSIAYLANLVLL